MPPDATHRRLLALDLDGTLVRADQRIDARDRAAIARARARGVSITIATGRLAPTAIAIARDLALDAPLICVDGAALVCPRAASTLALRPIAGSSIRALIELALAHDLEPFVASPTALVGARSGLAHAPSLKGYDASINLVPRLADAIPRGPVLLLALGPRDRVEAAHTSARSTARARSIELARFDLGQGNPWALRASPAGAGKGAALADLAARLGVDRAHVAAVGDWTNDLTMLAWAGRSFAMGHSPDIVKRAASDVLDATSETGGGVAEALDRWLSAR